MSTAEAHERARGKARAFLRGRGAAAAAPPAPPEPPEPAALADHATLLAQGRGLGWRSRVLVEGFRQGRHRSRLTGFSSEFAQYKPYAPGDDPRHLDWHVLARLDRACVRQHEAEVNLTAHLLVDTSGSMGYRSEAAPRSKADHAALLAAAFARILSGQGDACGVEAVGGEPSHVPPALGRAHTDRVLALLEQAAAAPPAPPAADAPGDSVGGALARLAPRLRRRGLVAAFTDGFEPLPPLLNALRLLRAAGHDAVLVQVVDPQELSFEFPARGFRRRRFQDLETGVRVPLAPALVRPRYLAALDAHQAELTGGCRGLGVHHVLARTDRSPFQALLDVAHGHAGGPRSEGSFSGGSFSGGSSSGGSSSGGGR